MLYSAPQSKAELLARHAQGERYFACIELPEGTDLRHADLSGAVFAEATLNSVNFQFANLADVSFRNANVKCSDFRYANLRGASFAGATVEAILLVNAILIDIRIDGASYYGYTLQQQDLDAWLESLAQ